MNSAKSTTCLNNATSNATDAVRLRDSNAGTLSHPKYRLTAAELRAAFDYDPETGEFWRRKQCRSQLAVMDRPSGMVRKRGYCEIELNGQRYSAHRLAWLYFYGEWPTAFIDHINGIKTDNRVANLRDVNRVTNGQNLRRVTPRSKTGLIGAYKTGRGAIVSYIRVDGKYRYLGTFPTPEAASTAFIDAKRRLHAGCTI